MPTFIFIIFQRLLLPLRFTFTFIKTNLSILNLFFYQDDTTYTIQFQLYSQFYCDDCYHSITPFILSRRRYVLFHVQNLLYYMPTFIFIILQRLLLPLRFTFTIIKTNLSIFHLFFYQDDTAYNIQFQLHLRKCTITL
jgi:sulfur relay (sulfurtransferase) complex TusBCD TusD component (DsrE family)